MEDDKGTPPQDAELITSQEELHRPEPTDTPPQEPSPEDADIVAADGNEKVQLATITTPSIDNLLADPLAQELKEAMETAQEDRVFEVADKFADNYMLERVVPTLPAQLQEAARMVIEFTNFSKVPPEYLDQFTIFSQVHQSISRQLILHMLSSPENTRGFNEIERAELTHGIEIANAMDDIYRKWANTKHSIPDAKERETRGFKSSHHIVRKVPANPKQDPLFWDPAEVSYKKLFAEEYERMDTALDNLIKDLKQTSESEQKASYYEALRAALNTTDPKDVTQVWREVDRKFVHQGGRIITTHPVETGYADNDTGAIPQFSMRFKLENNPTVKHTKEALQSKLPKLLQGNEKALERVETLPNPDLAHFAIRSGWELIFRIAGQNLPNDETVRKEEGMISAISSSAMIGRIREASPLFKQFLDPSVHQMLDEITDTGLLAGVAVHEMGHNIGAGHQFASRTEDQRAIEEWKASATEFALQAEDMENLSTDELEGEFAGNVCQALRYIQQRAKSGPRLYYKAYQGFMGAAQEVGLLTKGENGRWTIDSSKEKFVALAEKIKDQWVELQGIYERGNTEELDAFIAKTIKDSPFMTEAAEFIDNLK